MSTSYIRHTLMDKYNYDDVLVYIDYNLCYIGVKSNGEPILHEIKLMPESLNDMQNTSLIIMTMEERNKEVKQNKTIIRRGV